MPQHKADFDGELTFTESDLPEHTRQALTAHEARRARLASTMVSVASELLALFSEASGGITGWELTITQRGRTPWKATISAMFPHPSAARATSARIVLDPKNVLRQLPTCVNYQEPPVAVYSMRLDVNGAHDGKKTPSGGYSWKYGSTAVTVTPPTAT